MCIPMKKLLLPFLLLPSLAYAQYAGTPEFEKGYRSFLGFGSGVSFGGTVGIMGCYEPIPKIGVAGGLGFNVTGLGMELTTYIKLQPKRKFNFLLIGTVGSSEHLVYKHRGDFSKVKFAPSAGVGGFLKVGSKLQNRMMFTLNYTFKGQTPYELGYTPISANIGFHFSLKTNNYTKPNNKVNGEN